MGMLRAAQAARSILIKWFAERLLPYLVDRWFKAQMGEGQQE